MLFPVSTVLRQAQPLLFDRSFRVVAKKIRPGADVRAFWAEFSKLARAKGRNGSFFNNKHKYCRTLKFEPWGRYPPVVRAKMRRIAVKHFPHAAIWWREGAMCSVSAPALFIKIPYSTEATTCNPKNVVK